eukprot:1158005-Pelagomonas_calceolata.AAC.3
MNSNLLVEEVHGGGQGGGPASCWANETRHRQREFSLNRLRKRMDDGGLGKGPVFFWIAAACGQIHATIAARTRSILVLQSFFMVKVVFGSNHEDLYQVRTSAWQAFCVEKVENRSAKGEARC